MNLFQPYPVGAVYVRLPGMAGSKAKGFPLGRGAEQTPAFGRFPVCPRPYVEWAA